MNVCRGTAGDPAGSAAVNAAAGRESSAAAPGAGLARVRRWRWPRGLDAASATGSDGGAATEDPGSDALRSRLSPGAKGLAVGAALRSACRVAASSSESRDTLPSSEQAVEPPRGDEASAARPFPAAKGGRLAAASTAAGAAAAAVAAAAVAAAASCSSASSSGPGPPSARAAAPSSVLCAASASSASRLASMADTTPGSVRPAPPAVPKTRSRRTSFCQIGTPRYRNH
mmetsp:Transcript_15463/g.58593  ORF Transcript_15463/g.58593 Transcript_15463/m.58593 type:complete len:229 (-) Transcript_15463:2041-2727(-)